MKTELFSVHMFRTALRCMDLPLPWLGGVIFR